MCERGGTLSVLFTVRIIVYWGKDFHCEMKKKYCKMQTLDKLIDNEKCAPEGRDGQKKSGGNEVYQEVVLRQSR